MSDSRLFLDYQFLRTLSPLDKASPHQLSEIANQIAITPLRPNQPLFKQGDNDNQTVYLLKGTVELFKDGAIIGTISSGTNTARHPLAHKQPREMSALTKSEATVARIDSALLDFLLTSDHSTSAQYEIAEIDAETVHDAGWLTRILQSKAFLRLPMDNIQKMIARMQPVEVRAGDAVVREGDEGDYYYVIKQGSCAVTRKAANGTEVTLAELHDGDGFGEEALLSGTRRNATLTMTTDGTLMRLPKHDFLDLLIVPLLTHVKYEEAAAQVRKGAAWLDVRPREEYRQSHLKGSINLPLSELRESAAKLDAGRTCIVCCNTGRHSIAAAFLLSERGFDTSVLIDGLKSVPADVLTQMAQPVAAQAAAAGASPGGAEIINFKGPTAKHTAAEARHARPSPPPTDAEIERLKAELEQVRSRSEAQVAQIKNQTRAYIDEIKREAATAVEHAEKARQNAEQKVKELENALAQARHTARATNEGASAQAAKEPDAPRAQLEQARNEALKLRAEVATLKIRLGELEVVAVETDLAHEELTRLKDEAATLKGELQKARARAAAAGEQKRQAEEEAAHLKIELESLASRAGQASQNGNAEQARAALEQEVRRLRTQLAEAQQKRDEPARLKDEIATRDAELHALRDQSAALAQEKARLEAARSAAETKLTQAAAEHQASRAALEAELAAFKSRLAAMAETTEGAATAVQQQAEERMKQLTAEIEKLHQRSAEDERAHAAAEQARAESTRRLAQLEAEATEERKRLQQALAAAENLAHQETRRRKESEAELQTLQAQDRGASRGAGIDAGEVARFNDEIARLVQENQYLETMRREDEETITSLRQALAEFKQRAEGETRHREQAEEDAAALRKQSQSPAQFHQDTWDTLLEHPARPHTLPDAATAASKFEIYGEWLGWHMRRMLAAVGGLLLVAAIGGASWFAYSEGWFAQYIPWAAMSTATDDSTESAPTEVAESTPARKAEPAQRNQQPPAAERQSAEPKPQRAAPVRTLRDMLASGGSGPVMAALPDGIFVMGSGSGSPYFDERPQHTVNVKRFAISKHEITFAEYDAFAAATGRPRPNDQGWGRGERPVINVTWQDAAAYTEWLSQQTGHRYRLPSEAEWEYAARAGSGTLYWWGLEPPAGKAVCFDCGSRWDGKQTAPVGSLKANAFGLHDVSGNVEEWVQDCYYSNYDGAPDDARVWKGGDCSQRITRGGSYRNTKTEMRTSRRGHYAPNTRLDTLGFRVVREY